jgi:hypothetical protein
MPRGTNKPFMLSVIMLNVVKLSAVMLNVVARTKRGLITRKKVLIQPPLMKNRKKWTLYKVL